MPNSTKLLCFESLRYFDPLDDNDRQCIAPTAQGTRCSFEVRPEELEELKGLVDEISKSPPKERNSTFERILLLRACSRWHRKKLKADKHCLTDLSECLAEKMAGNGLIPISLPADSPVSASPPQTRKSSVSTDQHSPGGRRYILRPRLDLNKIEPSGTLTEPASLFVPYRSAPRDSVNHTILQPVPVRHSTEGYVYAFTWAASPGFVKIGYSTSVAKRMAKWEKCHPGLTMIHAVKFQFPHRLERLIHLELAEHRQQITLCTTCSSTHYEWFKTSASYVISVINHWKAVAEKAPLYTINRAVVDEWWSRMANLKPNATAKILLDLLSEE